VDGTGVGRRSRSTRAREAPDGLISEFIAARGNTAWPASVPARSSSNLPISLAQPAASFVIVRPQYVRTVQLPPFADCNQFLFFESSSRVDVKLGRVTAWQSRVTSRAPDASGSA
jgi:hypothetical protein